MLSEWINLLGIGSFGVSLGFIFGVITRRFLNPSLKSLEKANELTEEHYKKQVARMRGYLKEYEQPTELQQIAHDGIGSATDLAGLFSGQLANIKGIPRWIRPFIPAIQSYIKENPQQVEDLIKKFITQPNKSTKVENMDFG